MSLPYPSSLTLPFSRCCWPQNSSPFSCFSHHAFAGLREDMKEEGLEVKLTVLRT